MAETTTELQSIASDGLLFGLIALFIFCVVVLIRVFTLNSWDGRGPNAFFSMAEICCLVLTGTSASKFIRARRAGSKTFGLSDGLYTGLRFLGSIVLFTLLSALPIAFRQRFGACANLVCWTAPFMVTGWALIRNYSNNKTPENACAYTLGASVGSMFYTWGLCWEPLLFGFKYTTRLGELFDSHARPYWIMCLGVGLSAWVALFLSGICQYIALPLTSDSLSRKLSNTFAKVIAIGFIVTGTNLASFKLSNYWALLSLILIFPVALKLGAHVSSIRHVGDVSLVRKAFFTLPFFILALLIAEVMGMAGSWWCFNFRNASPCVFESRCEWVWHSPEMVRGSIASIFTTLNPQKCAWGYAGSMLPLAELQATALAGNTYRSHMAWLGWIERDPDGALLNARAVAPLPSGVLLANSAYDFSAGSAIAKLGSLEDCRVRLNGSYSREFVTGMLWGISDSRIHELVPEISSYCSSARVGFCEWRVFAARLPNEAKNVAQALLANQSSCNCVALERALSTSMFEELEQRAFESDDVNLRRIAFRQYQNYPNRDIVAKAIRSINRLIAAAYGELPNSNDNERRDAIRALAQCVDLEIENNELQESPNTLSNRERLLRIKALIASQDYCSKLSQPQP